jgi:hypothetical protein
MIEAQINFLLGSLVKGPNEIRPWHPMFCQQPSPMKVTELADLLRLPFAITIEDADIVVHLDIICQGWWFFVL